MSQPWLNFSFDDIFWIAEPSILYQTQYDDTSL